MAEIEDQLRQYANVVEASIEMTSRNPEASPRGRFPVLLAAAALVLVAGLAIWWLTRPAAVDVIGQPDVVADDGVTTPATPQSTTTTLPAQPVIPDWVGLRIEDAERFLAESPDIAEYSVTIVVNPSAAGTVIDQVIEPLGERFAVWLRVSSGPEVVAVPDVEGLEGRVALDLLESAGFTTIIEAFDFSQTVPAGVVIRTEPEGGQLLVAGAPIVIVISDDMPFLVIVPQLDGLFADTAIMTLRNAGLDPIPIFEPVPAGSPQVGRIIAQIPAAFAEVEAGTPVTITIGEPTAETTTTTVAQ